MKKISFIVFLFLVSSIVFTKNSFAVSLDHKIGQMIMVGFNGLSVDKNSEVVKQIRKYHLGGIVLYEENSSTKKSIRNIKSPAQLRKLTSDLQKNSNTPLFIAIDQEGGVVNRLKEDKGFPKTLSAERLGKLNNFYITHRYAKSMANVLKDEGINVNFAPVVDLNVNPSNPIIGKKHRAFSADPKVVVDQAEIFIHAFKKQNIICALKHFPGHGSSYGDTHEGFVDVTKTWREKELLPYKKLLKKSSCDMVMVAHVFNATLDPYYPASLSRKTVTGLLRNKLKFSGIVISDDMQMKAISDHYSLKKAIRLAVNAGNDILIFSNQTKHYDKKLAEKVFLTLKQLVIDGEITRKHIDESYRRIDALKRKKMSRGV